MLWCDIDRLKSLNDAHGHAAGDAVLAALGERIAGSLRMAADLAGRISGDELVVVLGGMRHLADATARADDAMNRAKAGGRNRGVAVP